MALTQIIGSCLDSEVSFTTDCATHISKMLLMYDDNSKKARSTSWRLLSRNANTLVNRQ